MSRDTKDLRKIVMLFYGLQLVQSLIILATLGKFNSNALNWIFKDFQS